MSPRDTQQVLFPSKASSASEAPGTSGGKALEDSPEPVLFLLGSTSECPQSQIYKNIQPSALLLRQTVACMQCPMAKSNGPRSCWGPVLAVKCLSASSGLSRLYKIPESYRSAGSHNSSHSRFNLAASNSYLWR